MTEPHPPFPATPTRRQWLVLVSAGLSGCGGGSMQLADGPPGTGGSGFFASGPVMGFGSVILNGIRFDDSSASIKLDGATARSADLRLGMVASVLGAHGSSATAGSAASVEVWSIAQGLVTSVGPNNQFSVADMALQGDSATVLDGISSLAQLAAGQRVTVWGLQGAADGRNWTATRIGLSSSPLMVSTGYVTLVDNRRFLNGLWLTGTLADNIALGPLLRVQGNLAADGGSLALTGVQPQGTAASLPSQVDCEVAGLVTATGSGSGGAYSAFSLGNYPVDSSGASISPVGATLSAGTPVQVSGNWQNGVLKVRAVTVNSEAARRAVQITAVVEQFTSLANFVVRGHRCDASGASFSGGATAADVKLGANLQLNGSIAGNVVLVSTLALAK